MKMYAFGIWLLDCSELTINWKSYSDVTICQNDVIVNFLTFFLFFLSGLVNGPSFMSISSLVLEL